MNTDPGVSKLVRYRLSSRARQMPTFYSVPTPSPFKVSGGSCRINSDCNQGRCDVDKRCRCFVGWSGNDCKTPDIDQNHPYPCDHFVCSSHGHCHTSKGYQVCQCDPGWHGIICDILHNGHIATDMPTTQTSYLATTTYHESSNQCGNHHCYHGYCDLYRRCVCDRGYSGYDCSINNYKCGEGSCYHGDCLYSRCYCHAGWSGSECETPLHEYACDGQPCYHGNCEWAPYRQQKCKCFSGWTGSDCTAKVQVSGKPCGYGRCYHGRCYMYSHDRYTGYPLYRCSCDQGWTGSSCSQTATRCGNTHCYHGICHHDISHKEVYCTCDQGWTGKDCNTREEQTTTEKLTTTTNPTVQTTAIASLPTTTYNPTTATTTTTTNSTGTMSSIPSTSTTTKSTTPSPLHTSVCAKVLTVSDIGNSIVSSNNNAVSCASGNKTSPEAFVLEHCNLTTPSTWKEGVNVMADCKAVPPYTPIASFGNHQYSSAGTLCGVFIGCLSDGFQMGVQYCDQPAIIEHVVTNNGLFVMDPTTYFTILQ